MSFWRLYKVSYAWQNLGPTNCSLIVLYQINRQTDRHLSRRILMSIVIQMVYNTMHMIQVIQINRTKNKGKKGEKQ